MSEEERVRCFINGILPRIKAKLKNKKPKTMLEAVEIARRKEEKMKIKNNLNKSQSNGIAEQLLAQMMIQNMQNPQVTTTEKTKKVRKIETVSSDEESNKKRKIREDLKEVKESMEKIASEIKKVQEDRKNNEEKMPARELRVCDYCHKAGHIRRDCWNLRNNERGRYQPRRQEPRRQYDDRRRRSDRREEGKKN
jgi:hypothetical protein